MFVWTRLHIRRREHVIVKSTYKYTTDIGSVLLLYMDIYMDMYCVGCCTNEPDATDGRREKNPIHAPIRHSAAP